MISPPVITLCIPYADMIGIAVIPADGDALSDALSLADAL